MSLTVTATERIPQLEAGVYPAVCSMIIDLGEQYNALFNESKQKVQLVWEIKDETVTIDGAQQPRQIFKEFTLSLDERSNLRKMLQSWRGRVFTAEELKSFNLGNLLGKCCQLQLIPKTTERGTYTVVENIMMLPKGTPKFEASRTVTFDLSDPATYGVFETLPRFTQEKIAQAQGFEVTGLTVPERKSKKNGAQPTKTPSCGDFEEIPTDEDDVAF